jgi:CRP-like cAMP-binding protein
MADLYALFEGLPPEVAAAASPRFLQMVRSAGDVIIEEGEVHDAMFLIEHGLVTVQAGGFEVARLGAGACLGEIGLFAHAVRTATVRAATPVTLQVLSRQAYLDLRNVGNPVAWRIERRAIKQLGTRFQKVVADIVRVVAQTPSMLGARRGGDEHRGHPLLLGADRMAAAIRDAAAFEGADPEALARLSKSVVARTYGARETLAAQGGSRGPMVILVSGEVDCHAAVGAQAVRVATLTPGDVFNLEQHVTGEPRPVSYVARDGTSVLELAESEVPALIAGDDPLGSVVRIAMIRSLADRVNQANAVYSMAKLTSPEAIAARGTPAPAPARSAAGAAPPPAPLAPSESLPERALVHPTSSTPMPAPARQRSATPGPAAPRGPTPPPARPRNPLLTAPSPLPLRPRDLVPESQPGLSFTPPAGAGFERGMAEWDSWFDTTRKRT